MTQSTGWKISNENEGLEKRKVEPATNHWEASKKGRIQQHRIQKVYHAIVFGRIVGYADYFRLGSATFHLCAPTVLRPQAGLLGNPQ